MVEIKFRDDIVSIPALLEELNSEQYMEFLILATIYGKGVIDLADFLVKWMSKLLGLNVDYTNYKKHIVYQLDEQLPLLDGFFKDVEREDGCITRMPILSTGRNMLKEYCGWCGPDDMLNNITFGDLCKCVEFMREADMATIEGAQEKIDGIYTELAMILYNYSGDQKPTFPLILVIHAVSFFANVWNMILSAPISINGSEIDFSIIFKASGGQKADDKTGWTGVAFETASSGVFGTIKDVNASPMWEVLLYLYKCKFEYLHNKYKLK